MSRLTAMMSARCTITSARRRSCRDRMLRSMVRSTAVKPTSSGCEASSTTCRSSRTDPAFQPNRVRTARSSQFSEAGRATSPGGTIAGRLRMLRGLSWVGSESAISIHPLPVPIGIGNPETRQNLYFERFHRLGVVVVFVIVAYQMQETVDRKMAQVMRKWLGFLIGFPVHGLIGDRDVAKHARCIMRLARPRRPRCCKRQHIGWLVDAAEFPVEVADPRIVGQHDRKFGPCDVGVHRLGGCCDRAPDDGLGLR